ncbi:MAG: N-acetyltransferase [Spirochaetes bacterium]|nr:N-acetyltransferase [Spirochaetota bacterium]
MQLVHDQENKQFYISISNQKAVLKYRITSDGNYDLYHTFVPQAARNKGIAAQLVKAAIQCVQEKKVKIIPTCPYIKTFIRKFPQYQSFLI